MTAHPKIDPATGEMLFFGYSPMAPYLRYSEVNAAGELVHTTEIDIPAPVMMHDFVITENYAIFLDAPAVFDMTRMLEGGEPMSWKPDNGTRIGVVPRGGSNDDVRWFETDNCYVVHFFNAWESGDTIEIHAPRMSDMPGGFQFENPGAAPRTDAVALGDRPRHRHRHRRADRRRGRRVPPRQRAVHGSSHAVRLQLPAAHLGVRVRLRRRGQVRLRHRQRRRRTTTATPR